MPALSNGTTILDSVMNELRIPVSNLTERTKIQAVVNGVYSDVCAKSDWWWLQRQTTLNTAPKITTGTVSVTEGSAAITFSTAPTLYSLNISVEAYVFAVTSNALDSQAVYFIDTHTSGTTAATLDAGYTGGTDTAAAYRLYRVQYNLPDDCAKLLQVKRYGRRDPLQRIGIEDLNYLRMNTLREGKPEVYSIFDFKTTNDVSDRRLLQIWPYPDQAYRMELWYKQMSANDITTDLDLPIDFQQVLIYGGLARSYAIFLNDLDRSSFFQSLFNDVMALMVQQQREYASDKPGVAIDMRMYRNAPTRSRVGGRSLGPYFDILPFQP